LSVSVCRIRKQFPTSLDVGYAGIGAYNLSVQQARLGVRVTVLAKGKPLRENIDSITVLRSNVPFNLFVIRELRKLGGKRLIDLIHAHATDGYLCAPLRKVRLKMPLAVHVHGTNLGSKILVTSSEFSEGFYSAIKERCYSVIAPLREKLLWQEADLLFAVSNYVKRELVSYYDLTPDKIEVVHNGVDPLLFKRVSKRVAEKKFGLVGEPRILYVGHLGRRKGLLYLIKALCSIKEQYPKVNLVIAGGIPEHLRSNTSTRNLRAFIRRLDLTENVQFLGFVRHRELPVLYTLADVFVLPSIYEPFGKTIIEAMACETPVVATRSGGPEEILIDCENGYLVDPRAPYQLADRIINLLNNPVKARNMGKKGRSHVLQNFTWNRAALKITSCYNKILN